ncbi:MAG: phosphopantetheine adenylyltransferase [Pseudomonadales bacterium]
MNERIITLMLLIVAVIHLLPVAGFVSAERLSALYGVSIEGPNLEILMRHRAVLFGLLGAFFVYAAFNTAVQPLAFIAAFISVSSFFYLAWSIGGYNSAMATVVRADLIAAVCLLVAVVLYYKH